MAARPSRPLSLWLVAALVAVALALLSPPALAQNPTTTSRPTAPATSTVSRGAPSATSSAPPLDQSTSSSARPAATPPGGNPAVGTTTSRAASARRTSSAAASKRTDLPAGAIEYNPTKAGTTECRSVSLACGQNECQFRDYEFNCERGYCLCKGIMVIAESQYSGSLFKPSIDVGKLQQIAYPLSDSAPVPGDEGGIQNRGRVSAASVSTGSSASALRATAGSVLSAVAGAIVFVASSV